jgi:aminoglycoside phosphotransferase (APT) family kinase protein
VQDFRDKIKMTTPEQNSVAENLSNRRRKKYDLATVEAVIKDDFRLHISSLSEINPTYLGKTSEVYSGLYDDQKVIIKIGRHARRYRVEVAGLELFHKYGVPSPQTLAFRKKAKYIDKAVLIQTAAYGAALKQLSMKQITPKLWQAAGGTLRRIHDIKLEGFGTLDLNSGKLEGQSATLNQRYLNQKPYVLHYFAKRRFASSSDIEKIEAAFCNILEADVGQASFLHNDFNLNHIFTDGEQITGIIDLSAAYAGDPRSDIAVSHYFLPPNARADFDRGYGDLALDRLVSQYDLAVAARKLVLRDKRDLTDRIPGAIEILKKTLNQVSFVLGYYLYSVEALATKLQGGIV